MEKARASEQPVLTMSHPELSSEHCKFSPCQTLDWTSGILMEDKPLSSRIPSTSDEKRVTLENEKDCEGGRSTETDSRVHPGRSLTVTTVEWYQIKNLPLEIPSPTQKGKELHFRIELLYIYIYHFICLFQLRSQIEGDRGSLSSRLHLKFSEWPAGQWGCRSSL